MKKYLDLPIFSIVCLADGVLVSCGGGGKRVGLENCLFLFAKPTFGILKDPIDTMPLNDEIFEKMRLNQKTQLIVANSENKCVLLQVVEKKIIETAKFTTDFAEQEAYQNDGVLNNEGDTLATGGEDGKLRLWDVKLRGEQALVKKVGQIDLVDKVMSIDFHVSQPLLIAACDNFECKIINYKQGKIMQRLSIQEKNLKQLKFHSALFSLDETTLYTFKNPMRGNSYMTVWKFDGDYAKPIKTVKVHGHPVVTTCQSKDGMFLGVGCSDGCAKVINTRYNDVEAKGYAHEMPIKALCFTPDARFLVSGSADFTYNFLPNARPESWYTKLSKLWFLGMFLAYFILVLMDLFN